MKKLKMPDLGVTFASAVVLGLASVPVIALVGYHQDKMECVDAGGSPVLQKWSKFPVVERCEFSAPK